jgi:hypothetical protein
MDETLVAAVRDYEHSQMSERHKVAMRLVDAFILEFGKVSPELARVAHAYYSQAELRDIGLKVFTCSTNKITVALGVDDPDDIQERIGIRIHEQFYPPPR